MKRILYLGLIIAGFVLISTSQNGYTEEINLGSEDPNSNYNVEEKVDKKDEPVISSDELNKKIEDEINAIIKQLHKKLSKELREQIKAEVKKAVEKILKANKKLSIKKAVKRAVKRKIKRKKVYRKRYTKPMFYPKKSVCCGETKKIEMTEVKNGGYIQYIKIADDCKCGETVHRGYATPIIIIARTKTAKYGNFRLYAKSIKTGKTYKFYSLPRVEFLKGYAEDQFLWYGKYWKGNRKVNIPRGEYKVYCEIDLLDSNYKKIGFLKRFWGKNIDSYKITVR